MTRHRRVVYAGLSAVVMAVAVGLGTYVYNQWQTRPGQEQRAAEVSKPPVEPDAVPPVRISWQARKNLGLTSKPLQPTTYWRKIEVPAMVTDRPGVSDRGVVAPVTGVVTRIHVHPGDTVAPEAPLFTLRLASESLHTSQLELFKATKEVDIARQQKKRLESLVQSGGVAGSRIIDLDNQIQRMEVQIQAQRQFLLARGLPAARIEAAAQGEFITEIVVYAPGEQALEATEIALASAVESDPDEQEPERLPFRFELQSLNVELGQQVEAGGVLCHLADHRALQIEGRGFKKDLPLIQRAARDHLPIDVTFEVREGSDWPVPPRELRIRYVANVIDAPSRTFAFYLPLENQWQAYTESGQPRLIWRFRPGDRVKLAVPVERFDHVLVLPRGAVVREGPEAYVFRQNGDLFDRPAVHVLHEDSTSVVLAADEALRPSFFIAQNAAASLNRILKAQLASGVPTNLHVHADGTVHAAH